MFFKPSVDKRCFPILEVGPGALPFALSDVWLDKWFDCENRVAQSGHTEPASGKPLFYYNGGKFPFKDKAFRYVIASHVLEHIPWENVSLFLSELERVAAGGYIELPRWTYELVNQVPEHLSVGDVRAGKLHLYKKNTQHDFHFFTAALLEKSGKFRKYIEEEKDLFFCRLEWRRNIPYETHDNGYPIVFERSEIVTALKLDCDRFAAIEPVTVRSLARKVKQYLIAVANRVIRFVRRRFGVHYRAICRRQITNTEILDILRCPLCGHPVATDFVCCHCGLFFKKTGKEYLPNYLRSKNL